jgi:type IX secretion system PorP/SprF family membrane protein
MKKYILSFFLCIVIGFAFGQQDPLYSQFINNPMTLNPAMAGLNNKLTTNISYRKQWNGLDGSPKTLNASGHMSILDNRGGVGLIVVSDQVGSSKVTEAYAVGSYRVNIASGKVLSFGLQLGTMNYSIGGSKANVYDSSDPYFQGSVKQVKPGVGAGAVYQTSRFTAGFSVPRMLKATTNTDGNSLTMYNQHFYLMGSYLFDVAPRVQFKPSVLFKGVHGAPLSTDINAMFIIANNYQVGILARNLSSFGAFGRVLIKDRLSVGYVYEKPTNKSVGSPYSTFEIMLGFQMKVLRSHNTRGAVW